MVPLQCCYVEGQLGNKFVGTFGSSTLGGAQDTITDNKKLKYFNIILSRLVESALESAIESALESAIESAMIPLFVSLSFLFIKEHCAGCIADLCED